MTTFDLERTLGTALTGQGGKATVGRPVALRSDGLRCAPAPLRFSVPRPAAKLPPLTSFAVVEQRPRVSLRSALARAASGPAMLGVLDARHRPARRRLADAHRCLGENSHGSWPRRAGLAWREVKEEASALREPGDRSARPGPPSVARADANGQRSNVRSGS